MNHEQYKDYAVSLITDSFKVSREDLLGGTRTEEAVDARCALIHILAFQGVRAGTIKEWTGVTPSSQSYLLQCYEYRWRSNPWFKHQMIAVIKEAKRTCPIAFRAHDKDGSVVLHEGNAE